MFVTLLRRITGTDDRQLEAERRFHRNLNGMAQANDDLDRLTDEVDRVIERMEMQSVRQRISIPSGVSGEHQLDLPAPTKSVQEAHVRGPAAPPRPKGTR